MLIDLDPQGHCALGMAVPDEQIDLSILDCLLSSLEGEPLDLARTTWQITPNLDLAPSKSNLATFEPRIGERENADMILRDLLASHAERYECCVIDSPPHFGMLMKNGLRAADDVIIPVDTGYFSLHGLQRQIDTIETLRQRSDKPIGLRVLANQYDVRTKLAREILAELRSRFKGVLLDTIVNFNTKLKEGASFGQVITEFAPTSIGARDFQALAREIIAKQTESASTTALLDHAERLAADADRLLATTATLIGAGSGGHGDPTASAKPAVAQRSVAAASPPRAPVEVAPRPHQIATPRVTPVQSAVSRGSAPVEAAPPSPKPATHKEIDRKIEGVYGVSQTGDVIVFRTHLPSAAEAQVAGDFNDWMPHTTPMRRLGNNGDFEARLQLPVGRYRYRLVVDGRWTHDVNNPAVESNDYGELNSILEVRK